MVESTPQLFQAEFWHMGGYGIYIWSSYALAAVVMLWLLLRARAELKHAEKRLKQLQSATSPASEKG